MESEWRGLGEVLESRTVSKDRPAGRAEEASGGAGASVFRAVEPEWDKTRHGEEDLVRIGGNGASGLRAAGTKGLDPSRRSDLS